MCWLTMTLFY